MPVDHLQKPGMFGMADPAKVRNTADIPQKLYRFRIRGARHNLGLSAECLERLQIIRFARLHQTVILWCGFQRCDEGVDAAKAQIGAAPVQFSQRRKAMVGDRVCHIFVQRSGLARHPKGPVCHTAPGPARDLRQLIGHKRPHTPPVEFGQRRERNMVDIEVQTHADGIRRYQIIDLTILVEVDLRVPRARR